MQIVATTAAISVTNGAVNFLQPVGGSSAFSKPFRFQVASVTLSGEGPTTLTAAQYSCPIIEFSGSLSARHSVVFPTDTGTFYVLRNFTAQTVNPQTSGKPGFDLLTNKQAIAGFYGSTDLGRITADCTIGST